MRYHLFIRYEGVPLPSEDSGVKKSVEAPARVSTLETNVKVPALEAQMKAPMLETQMKAPMLETQVKMSGEEVKV